MKRPIEQRDESEPVEGTARDDRAWARDYLAGRREARECRDAASEIRALCESFNVDIEPDGDVAAEMRRLLAHAERVDPTTKLRQALRKNAAQWNPKHCRASAGRCGDMV